MTWNHSRYLKYCTAVSWAYIYHGSMVVEPREYTYLFYIYLIIKKGYPVLTHYTRLEQDTNFCPDGLKYHRSLAFREIVYKHW